MDIGHPDTPKKARFFAFINANERALIRRFKKKVFKNAGFTKSSAYRVLKLGENRTFFY